LEEKQRRARKLLEESGEAYKPKFFSIEEVLDPLKKKGKVLMGLPKEGNENYWARRLTGQWEGLPDLF